MIFCLFQGFAHGYLCLGKKYYLIFIKKKYSNKNNTGFCWNDKNFNIKWGIKKPILSMKDKFLKEYKI